MTAGPDPAPSTRAGGRAIGTDLAATAGAVVLRTPVVELIQYLPRTEAVRAVPLLLVPPLHHRFYLADLTPGHSLVEHHVGGGQQVFALSWRHPAPEDTGWDLDTCARAVLDAMQACERISGTRSTALMAFCAGGTLTAMVAAHLAASGALHRVAAVTFAATALGVPTRGDAVVAQGPGAAPELALWAADTVRVPLDLHRELVALAERDALAVPGAASILGTAVDLAKVDTDAYVVAGAADPRQPWPQLYRTTQLLGGQSRFVLAAGGHVAAVVPEASAGFRAGPAGRDAERWLAGTPRATGSWWADHLGWLAERTGPLVDAPPELGGRHLHPLEPAPGSYVSAR